METLAVRFEQAVATGTRRLAVALARYSEEQFLYYAALVPVIFQFTYADTPANQKRKRVGRVSGFRQGVRNLVFVPTNKQPDSPQERRKQVTYYDMGRANWRAFRRGNFINISAFWSESEGRFVDTPELAGITPGADFTPARESTPATDGTRETRTAAREAAKKQRERERAAAKARTESYRAGRKARTQNRTTTKLAERAARNA